jgi:hypothetical protein
VANFDLNVDHLDEPLHLARPSWMVAKSDRFNYATSVVARVGRVNFFPLLELVAIESFLRNPPDSIGILSFFYSTTPQTNEHELLTELVVAPLSLVLSFICHERAKDRNGIT